MAGPVSTRPTSPRATSEQISADDKNVPKSETRPSGASVGEHGAGEPTASRSWVSRSHSQDLPAEKRSASGDGVEDVPTPTTAGALQAPAGAGKVSGAKSNARAGDARGQTLPASQPWLLTLALQAPRAPPLLIQTLPGSSGGASAATTSATAGTPGQAEGSKEAGSTVSDTPLSEPSKAPASDSVAAGPSEAPVSGAAAGSSCSTRSLAGARVDQNGPGTGEQRNTDFMAAFKSAHETARKESSFNFMGRLDNMFFSPVALKRRQGELRPDQWTKRVAYQALLVAHKAMGPAYVPLNALLGNGHVHNSVWSIRNGEVCHRKHG